MMNSLFIGDLKDMSQEEVIEHIKSDYINGEKNESENINKLECFDVLIAYESVGSWGCDSSSFFLFKRRSDGALFENHGSHCSCYGFEGQFSPEETNLEYLNSDKFYFYTGGYDEDSSNNENLVSEFIAKL